MAFDPEVDCAWHAAPPWRRHDRYGAPNFDCDCPDTDDGGADEQLWDDGPPPEGLAPCHRCVDLDREATLTPLGVSCQACCDEYDAALDEVA